MRGLRSDQNNSVCFDFHLHIIINKSCTDDHGSRRSDITQGLLQRLPNRFGILLSGDEHPNAGDVFFCPMEALDGVDYLFEDD